MSANIIILDNDKDFLQLCQKQLKGLFEKIIIAGSAVEALSLFKENYKEISIIVCAYKINDGTGIEFVKQVQRIGQEIPVIFISAFCDEIEPKELSIKNFVSLIDKKDSSFWNILKHQIIETLSDGHPLL